MLTLVGAALVIVGLVLVAIGVLAFVFAAFRESLLWGLGVLFIPPLALVFLLVHWRVAKHGFLIKLWGLALIVLGSGMTHHALGWPLG